MSSVTLKFTGELGEVIEMVIPELPAGEKFERWGQAIVQVQSENASLKSDFGIEHSDVQHLLAQLIKVSPSKTVEWETMEGNVGLEFKTSALGNVELSAVVSSSKTFCRSATFRMPVTIQQVEKVISQLEKSLSPEYKKLCG